MNDIQKRENVLKAKDIYFRFLAKEVIKNHGLDEAVKNGLIPRSNLRDGGMYVGYCRNATIAKWDAAQNLFVFRRQYFNTFYEDTVPHPEDDGGFDVFAAVAEIEGTNNAFVE